MSIPLVAFIGNTIHADGPHGEPPLVAVTYGERGYCPIYTGLTAEEANEGTGITPEIADAFLIGSMFGWHAPGADPAHAYARSKGL